LAEADVVLVNGLHLEGKMGEVLENLSRTKTVMAVTSGVPRPSLLKTGGGSNAYDPHLWFDVSLWSNCIDAVASTLATKAPEHTKSFQDSADAYRKELLALHEEVRRAIAQIPKDRRVLITAHDAFQYFGRAYDIEVRGIQGISTESEAGLAEINSLVDLIVARRVKAVFVESSVSQKNVQALVEGARQRGANVKIGGQLFSDALGEKGTPAGDYVGMVRENVKILVEALR
jgi:manganese/zinc/iron transport system substrate-binding protein